MSNHTPGLEKVRDSILECRYCITQVMGRIVPGEGNPQAKIMLVGEAPGRKEDVTGRPFVGASGHLLDRLFRKYGMERRNFYITSVLKYYPGKRTIPWKETMHGMSHLSLQLHAVKPKLVVLLGNVALRGVSGDKTQSITKVRGRIIEVHGYRCLPTFHPAAILRLSSLAPLFETDMQLLSRIYSELYPTSYAPVTVR